MTANLLLYQFDGDDIHRKFRNPSEDSVWRHLVAAEQRRVESALNALVGMASVSDGSDIAPR